MLRIHYIFFNPYLMAEVPAWVEVETFKDALSGFYLNEQFNLTDRKDARYYIPPHQIRSIEIMKETEDG